MARRDDLIDALDALLEPATFKDLGPNGLQVPGAEEVTAVVTGVSATKALVERAVALDAQLVLVHHGLFWDFLPTGLSRVQAERLRPLFVHGISLAAYHLPLDAHPVLGNNALLASAIGATHDPQPFGTFNGRAIGVRAGFPEPITPAELRDRVRQATGGREPTAFLEGGPDPVRTIGVVSGAAAKSLPEALAAGLDAFVTGEPAEHVMADAVEGGIHFLAAGHYATETFGVRALGDRLARDFGVAHHWVDLPNPV